MNANPMGAAVVTIRVSKVERDLRVSLGFLIAGLLVLGGFYVLVWSGILNGIITGSLNGQLVVMAVAGMGEVFVLIGALFTGINWWLLRSSHTSA